MGSERQKELEGAGWQRTTTTDEPRLTELGDLYGSLGFEVHMEPYRAGDEECSECLAADRERFRTIYIRRKV